MKAAALDRKGRPSGAACRQEGREEGVLSRGHYQEGTEVQRLLGNPPDSWVEGRETEEGAEEEARHLGP